MAITLEQCRAARGLLGWSTVQLSREAELPESTLRDFEKGRHRLMSANMQKLIDRFEAAGVVFIDANGGGPGVRLKA